ncbi:MAG: hypothetical protein HY958_07485 [Bacteroidia bacterium]|nr:hypothetical protein [Bacteroidia bacterium]
MKTLERIAFYQNRRDDVPNRELARELAATEDKAGIKELVQNLGNKNKNIQSDCLKALYETGYIKPALIAEYAENFLNLLKSKNNRMVWGSMIALASVAPLNPLPVLKKLDDVMKIVEKGTVITRVWGIAAIARAISKDAGYNTMHFGFLLDQISKCIPRDVPKHAEDMLPAVNKKNKAGFAAVLKMRAQELTATQKARLKRVLRKIEVEL